MAPKANVVAAIPDGYRIYIYIFFVLIFVQEQTGIIVHFALWLCGL